MRQCGRVCNAVRSYKSRKNGNTGRLLGRADSLKWTAYSCSKKITMDELAKKTTSTRQCFIHFEGKSGELCLLTPHTISKISEYCDKWINLDGEQSEIAPNIASRIKRWSFDLEGELEREEIENTRYHKECYIRFCDKTKVERAEKRKKKEEEELSEQGEPSSSSSDQIAPVSVRVSPRTTLTSGSGRITRRNRHILPEQCIICKKPDAYIVDKVQ